MPHAILGYEPAGLLPKPALLGDYLSPATPTGYSCDFAERGWCCLPVDLGCC